MRNLWAIFRALIIKSIGRTSAGISLSLKTGMTSGETLEYIYDNRAQGKFFIGRLIDRLFLNVSDLKALRARKDNVKRYIIETLQTSKRSLVVVDIAAGLARYLREALLQVNLKPAEFVLMDTDDSCATQAKNIFSQIGINVRYENKNAFDELFLRSLQPIDLLLAVGFYDWINDDDEVKKSIALVSSILSKDGFFVLTIQSKNSDLTLMRYAFTDFNNNPLCMKVRSLAQMSEWLTAAGFKVEHSSSDRNGHYHTIKAVKL
jgi:hypothetical protein